MGDERPALPDRFPSDRNDGHSHARADDRSSGSDASATRLPLGRDTDTQMLLWLIQESRRHKLLGSDVIWGGLDSL